MVYPKHHVIKYDDGVEVRERQVPRIRKYEESNRSPPPEGYTVFIQRLPEGEMNQVIMAKKLNDKYSNDITTWFLNSRKMKVLCSTAKIANEICSSEELLIDFNVSIVFSNVEVKGKIPIPAEYTEKEIFDNATCYVEKAKFVDIKILEVSRVQRKNVNPKEPKTNTDTAFVTFEGNKIPRYIKFGHLYIPVFPYVERVLQCQKCWCYGHSTRVCRGKKRCVGCGSYQEHAHCENIECVNCNGSHKSNSKTCPIMIHKMGQMKKKSEQTVYAECNDTQQQDMYNYNETDFPSLPSSTAAEVTEISSALEEPSTESNMETSENTCRKRQRDSESHEKSQQEVRNEIKAKFTKSLSISKPWVGQLVETLESDMKDMDKSIMIETYFNKKLEEICDESVGLQSPTTTQ